MNEYEYKKTIRRFQHRLNREAWIRAGSIGGAAGLSAAATVLLYGRVKAGQLLLQPAVIAASVLFLAVLLLSYYMWLKPRKKQILQRIDAMGLEERVITMEELKQQETVMARKQRQDAKEHLAELNASSMQLHLYIKPLLWCLAMVIVVALLALLPFPEPDVDEQAAQNALEMEIVDEMILALKDIVNQSEINELHKSELDEIVDALAMSFTPEDSTLTRTAKIATASKRLDMYASSEQSELTLLKQQADDSEKRQTEIKEAEQEQKLLTSTIKEMKDTMGTSIDVLNNVEGTFWTPEGPSAGTSYDVEPLPTEEEMAEGEAPQEGEEQGEGEEPSEGGEPGENGEPQDGEGEAGEMNGTGGQLIYDPEQGEVSYGSVYEEYYQEILKALTEQEFSGEIREIIEDYANTLE